MAPNDIKDNAVLCRCHPLINWEDNSLCQSTTNEWLNDSVQVVHMKFFKCSNRQLEKLSFHSLARPQRKNENLWKFVRVKSSVIQLVMFMFKVGLFAHWQANDTHETLRIFLYQFNLFLFYLRFRFQCRQFLLIINNIFFPIRVVLFFFALSFKSIPCIAVLFISSYLNKT